MVLLETGTYHTRRNLMQLNIITELLQIPGFKVTHMVICTGSRIEYLLEREGERASVCSGYGRVHNTGVPGA